MMRTGCTLLMVSVVVAALMWRPAVAVALTVATATALHRWRMRRATKESQSAVDAMAEALQSLVLELRAGAHPVTAATSVAADCRPDVAGVLTTIAGTTRLGGNVHIALRATAARTPSLAGVINQLSRAWRLVQEHGLPLADVLAAVHADTACQVRFARQLQAGLAGPRSAAAVLTALPVLGILLGEAMGAHPTRVLLTTGPGTLLLLIGVLLTCAGVLWTARLTERVSPR
ncbi:MAG: type II secretion system F family protein [Sciscionella sp.]|nr:type II secretion system F family protein [Sciscionella sp.]